MRLGFAVQSSIPEGLILEWGIEIVSICVPELTARSVCSTLIKILSTYESSLMLIGFVENDAKLT